MICLAIDLLGSATSRLRSSARAASGLRGFFCVAMFFCIWGCVSFVWHSSHRVEIGRNRLAVKEGQGRVLFTCLYAYMLLLFIVFHLMGKLGKLKLIDDLMIPMVHGSHGTRRPRKEDAQANGVAGDAAALEAQCRVQPPRNRKVKCVRWRARQGRRMGPGRTSSSVTMPHVAPRRGAAWGPACH